MKTVGVRNEGYLNWIRRQECCVCHRRSRVEASHGVPLGLSVKGEDWGALPLCRECHSAEHRGRTSYWGAVYNVYRVTRGELVDIYNMKYCQKNKLTVDQLRRGVV